MVWRFSTSGKHWLPHFSVMTRSETVSLLIMFRGLVSVLLTHVSTVISGKRSASSGPIRIGPMMATTEALRAVYNVPRRPLRGL